MRSYRPSAGGRHQSYHHHHTWRADRALRAVLVSWMAKFNPLTMVLSSFLIIFMDRGAGEISTAFGLNHSYADILTGIILFFIIGCEFFISYRLQFRKKAEKEVQ